MVLNQSQHVCLLLLYFLENLYPFSSALFEWPEQNDGTAVELLVNLDGFDVNSRDRSGRTLLRVSWATEEGYVAVAKLLFGCGDVNVDSEDSSGRTLLSWAAQEGQEAVVKLLLPA
jgi:ankyrin repeat protein